MIEELVLKNRSYRRFDNSFNLSRENIEKYIDIARKCPSSGNLQPLKYFISTDNETNSKIFPCLTWAMYLKEWEGPDAKEHASSYVIILKRSDTGKDANCDAGIAAQTILLCATEEGLGGCIIRSIDKKRLIQNLNLNEESDILLVIALGKPIEKVKMVDIDEGDSIVYWRDEENTHVVPKRKLNDIIINL